MELRWYQNEAVDAVWQSLRTGAHPCVVLPTGAGKSLVIAEICKQAIENWNGRVIVLAHRKELLVQNAEKLEALIPDIDVGIYSAGLSQRDTDHDVICAGIQSVYQRAHEFGERHLVIVDESHLIPQKTDTMYRTFCDQMSAMNPKLRYIGLTATPYRLDAGPIVGGESLLTEVCYEVPVTRLIGDGFLSLVVNRKTDCEVDTSTLQVRGGEYTDHSQEIAFANLAEQAVDDIIVSANETSRKSVLVFCSSVATAERVCEMIEAKTGEEAACVTGETPAMFRSMSLKRFADREIRWLVNVSVLTTGFDAPVIDCIAVLRATMSPGLFAQIVGRGLRLFPGKSECVVLDYGGNIARHGAIDSPSYGKTRKGKSKGGEAPSKTCVSCGESMHTASGVCPWCGEEQPAVEEFIPDPKADESSEILQATEPRRLAVANVRAWAHSNQRDHTKPDTLCVHYDLEGNETVREWLCFNHEPGSFPHVKACEWWASRSVTPFPKSVHSALSLFDAGASRHPSTVTIKQDGKWQRIVSVDFDDKRPAFNTERFYLIEQRVDEPVVVGDDFFDEDIPF